MADITLMKTAAETGIAQNFERLKPLLPGDAGAREEAFRCFSDRGLPHRRFEEFKYTDLRAAVREAPPLVEALDRDGVREVAADAAAFAGIEAVRVSIINGHFAPEESGLGQVPEGVEIAPLAEALAKGHPLLASMSPVAAARDNAVYQLNAAFMTDGAVIRVGAGASVETPVHLRFINAGAAAFAIATRVLVVVEEGASVTLLESHEGPHGIAYQPNGVVEIIARDKAMVRHVRLNAEGGDALALSTLAASLGAGVSFSTLNVVAGSALSRHQVYVTYEGEGTTAQINGAAMLKGRQHADATLVVDHKVPHGESRELFKTVIDDEATGVFQGKIIVQPHAQKTDGRMMSGCLLLGEGGTMNNKPELEIFADDVQCAHGATCGALDEDLLFYLMARGLPKKEAESLMVQAFLGEAIEGVDHEGVRAALIEVVEAWLRSRG
jgi:Fe-S cluster assembly protein SufD